MIRHLSYLILCSLFLSACGYQGALYLPKENDQAQFGVIQTGLSIDSIKVDKETQPNQSHSNKPLPKETNHEQ